MTDELIKKIKTDAGYFIPERFCCMFDDDEPAFSAAVCRAWIGNGVMYGAHRYTAHVWHDSDKKQPEKGRTVVIWNPAIKEGEVLTHCVEVYEHRMWAYIEELLPQEGSYNPQWNYKDESV